MIYETKSITIEYTNILYILKTKKECITYQKYF